MSTKVKQIVIIRSARFCLGCMFAAPAFAISVLAYGKPKVGLFFTLLFILTGAVKIPDAMFSRRGLTVLYAVWLVLTAFATLFFSQFCLNEVLPDRGFFVTLLGTLLILCLYLIPIVFTFKIRVCATVVSAILILFTCLNYFVFVFRGSEIAPADLLSITAAGNVAAEDSFRIPAAMFYALSLSVIYFFASFALPSYVIDKRKKTLIVGSLIALVCAAAVWIGGLDIQPLHFLQTGSVMNGYLLNFTLLFRESFPIEPESYSSEIVDSIVRNRSLSEHKTSAKPDVIVVMDESFTNLSVLGSELKTDTEICPFILNLSENTIRGFSLSSVFGGGTPNSEYEFLTGNTFLFLPTGAIAYQQFVKEPSFSFARELRNKGYYTIAMHQSVPNSWMRETIWPLLGFEDCLFLDDFPQNDLLRNWGTDQELFEKLVSVYEEHREASDSPAFVFAVTIQNHGGYDYSEEDFSTAIHLEDYSQAYPDVEQYLTCIHETDKAVEWLIRYFEQVDRDVVILFYGDHFPKLSDAFVEEVHGGPFETLDERMLQYTVPFFIWTNYQSESEEIKLTSMNYLAGLLYQRAGMELPAYNQYLEQLRQTIPACNAFGYYSKSAGGFLPLEDAQGEEKQALWEYNVLEWNSLFDKENRNEVFFPVQ